MKKEDGLELLNKTCSACGVTKELICFPISKHGRTCKECKNAKQRERRKLNNDSDTKKYEKTEKGYLMRAYRNMLSRVTGVQHKKAHLYQGLEILSKEDFYKWSLEDSDFLSLFKEYKGSDFETRLAPSVDRKDSTLGYTLDNMRWLPHWKNSQLGALSEKRRIK